jgi:hypothetical protein
MDIRTLVIALTAGVFAAMSCFAADITSSLSSASRDEVELAANEDAVDYHTAHSTPKHDLGFLQSLGRAHALRRGIRDDHLLSAYFVTFADSVQALEQN